MPRFVKILEECPACVELLKDLHQTTILDRQLSSNPPQVMREYLKDHGPELIAFFTAFFPHGTYATLGRDAYFIGDVLEAFYVGLGLPSPVTRLRASSFTVKTMDDEMLAAFLVSNGLDKERVLKSEQTFVIIDRTPYRPDSQSARFYRAILNTSESPRERLNMGLNISVVSSQAGWPGWRESMSPAMRAEFATVKLNATDWPHYATALPNALFGPEAMNKFMDQDALAWHAPFSDRVVADVDGSLGGKPGVPDNLRLRRMTLRSFWDVYELLRTPRFREDVWRSGREFGLDLRAHFSASLEARTVEAKKLARLQDAIRGEVWDIADAMPAYWILSYAHKQLLKLVQGRLQKFHFTQDVDGFERDQIRREGLRAETGFTDPISRLFAEVSYDLPEGHFDENLEFLAGAIRRWTPGISFSQQHLDNFALQMEQNVRIGILDGFGLLALKAQLAEIKNESPHLAHICANALKI